MSGAVSDGAVFDGETSALSPRDPASGELVVADYKSDAVGSPAELLERAARYRAQGGAYVRAVHEALGLAAPPRFELWFLVAGERVAV